MSNVGGDGGSTVGMRRVAAYLIVMTLKGEVVSVRPTTRTPTTGIDDDRADDDDGHFGNESRWCASVRGREDVSRRAHLSPDDKES